MHLLRGRSKASMVCGSGIRSHIEGFVNGPFGYIGIMEKKMETAIMGLYRDYIGYILGLYWDNVKPKWKL